jgi:hypothetical protein
MSTKASKPRGSAARSSATSAQRAVVAANEHMLLKYVIGLLGGTPYHVSLPDGDVWIVPMILTSPAYGAIGEVGAVAVNVQTGQVVGGTPREEVFEAIRQLREAKHDAIEAAFLQARE